jgi:hypothetical protein
MRWNSMTPLSLIKRLWRRAWNARYTVTTHTVHCPEYDCDATVVIQTNVRTRRRWRHVGVTRCSVFPREPVYPPHKIDWVPDIPYFAVPRYPAGGTPVYNLNVPCHKQCLYLLNDALETGTIRQERCLSGIIDCVELEREATHNTRAGAATTRTPWSYV